MASVQVSSNFNMYTVSTWYGTVIAATPSMIQISGGPVLGTYYGSFSYDAYGNVYGTLTGFNETLSGSPLLDITGLNVSASTAEQLIQSDQLQYLFQTALAGNDEFTLSPGIHVLDGYGGYNTVSEPLSISNYTVTPSGNSIGVTSSVSSDTLYNIQRINFSDGFYDTQSQALVPDALVQNVQSAYAGILRTSLDTQAAASAAIQIAGKQTTLPQYENSLINSEQAVYTTLPALVTIDAMYGATPSPATLTTAATATSGVSYYTAAGLHNLGYSDPNVWTIMGSEWSADPNSSFYTTYGSYGSDYSSFIGAVYQQEFGYAPSAQNLQNLLSDVPGVQALLAGGGHPASPIQVVGGIYGYLLYVGQTYGIGQYASSAKAFLQATANGTVTYGPELTKEFPPATTQTSTSGTSSSVVMANAQTADSSIITVTGSDQLIDPGSGSYTIQFMAGASADTLVLHAGGVDQVSGFNPNADVLDFSSLLSGANIDLKGNLALLANYVGITDQGSDALVSFAPNGQNGGSTVAVLHGLGSTVTSLNSLLAAGAVRVA